MTKKGLSLLEILIACVILTLVMSGLANVFFMGKDFIVHSRSRIGSGNIGRYVFGFIQQQVRQDEWGLNCLGSGNCTSSNGSWTIDNVRYDVTWNVSDVGVGNLRKAVASITWTEPQ